MCTEMETFLFKAECRSLTYPEYRERNWSEIFTTEDNNVSDTDTTEIDFTVVTKDRSKGANRYDKLLADKAERIARKRREIMSDTRKINARMRKGMKRQIRRKIRNGNGITHGDFLFRDGSEFWMLYPNTCIVAGYHA